MNTINKTSPNVAALVTGAAALAIIGMGAFSAGANEGALKSMETAPAVLCASGESAAPSVFNATEFVGTDAVDIVNGYVSKTDGWTRDNFNPAFTKAEAITLGNNAITQVDVRDQAMRRIAVFTVSALDGGQVYLSKAFMCSTPVLGVIPGSVGDIKA